MIYWWRANLHGDVEVITLSIEFRPDMTFTEDWALKTNYLSIYPWSRWRGVCMHVCTTVFYLAIKHIDAANTSTSNHFGTISLHIYIYCFNMYDLMKDVTFRSYILNMYPTSRNCQFVCLNVVFWKTEYGCWICSTWLSWNVFVFLSVVIEKQGDRGLQVFLVMNCVLLLKCVVKIQVLLSQCFAVRLVPFF